MGFNNAGSAALAERLRRLRSSGRWPSVPVDALVYGDSNSSGFLGPDGQPFPDAHVPKGPSSASVIRIDLDTWENSLTPNAAGCIQVAP